MALKMFRLDFQTSTSIAINFFLILLLSTVYEKKKTNLQPETNKTTITGKAIII